MTLLKITEPSVEPITLEEAKLHLRVDHATDDDLITSLIVASREQAEQLLGRALITQTWERVLDAFPESEIELGMPPVQSITSVIYVDGAGDEITLDAEDYTLDSSTLPGYVLPSETQDVWPVTLDTVNAVRVRFAAGYGSTGASVPSSIRQWMLIQIGTMYKMREGVAIGVSVSEIPNRWVDGLLDRYRIWGI